ncbi:MAG: tetraacyldisaccharide 4'-kinase [Gammaproteobacteria bacterium]|nr:tetraacyldisaccharide 4'-kinase [Gammaproteobacteria bacterium]MDH5303239.1 tetraacyldisaccharide 4'-kinase [Gammaproteobacteria bacterium]MDH5322553.1 tetraacyldisaccharide 4'-kinase [Gammaproteobacteria bacterium]
MYNWLHRVWYEGAASYRLLLPLTGLYWLLVMLRRALFEFGVLGTRRAAAPVIVVGNITAGGTGKTPVTIWLAKELKARGFSPGIVSRGYGGSKSPSSMRVDAASDPAVVGDEPVLLARSSGCPIVVDADRFRAAEMLVADGADVIIADDGLQHYRLARTYEICVIDGARGLGNRYLLPAGPLRETLARLNEVDQVLLNGVLRKRVAELAAIEQHALVFELVASEARRLNGSLTRPIERFRGTTVHGVAAIGNPQRFFELLRSHGMQVIEHALPDHAPITRRSLDFGDNFEILMTEKDAVKLGRSVDDKLWSVPVSLKMDALQSAPWLAQVESRIRSEQGRQ